MINKIIRQNKGITGVDLTVAIFIIILFVSILATTIYAVYLSNASLKRNTVATDYATTIAEKIKTLDFDDVNLNTGTYEKINGKVLDIDISEGYDVILTITNYNETAGNEEKQDVIKLINIKIEYVVGKQEKSIEINTIKTK